jgi:hypothetical protein
MKIDPKYKMVHRLLTVDDVDVTGYLKTNLSLKTFTVVCKPQWSHCWFANHCHVFANTRGDNTIDVRQNLAEPSITRVG